MKLLIITSIEHKKSGGDIYGYAPYVREMNMWTNHADEIKVMGHETDMEIDAIDIEYTSKDLEFVSVPAFNIVTSTETVKTLFKLPLILYKMFVSMMWADHIHLRCPSNMGLLGSVVQIFFPHKMKTVKYAGTWSPTEQKHFTWWLQRRILISNFLSKNIKILSYGDWNDNNINVLPFFTATYSKKETVPFKRKTFDAKIKIIFVGVLNENKRALLSVQVAKKLLDKGYDIQLDIFGEGILREPIEQYIKDHNLHGSIILHGNKAKDVVKAHFMQAHFLFFFSQNEGWPKVVAEAMFLGCFPITTTISCLPYMLDNNERGHLINVDDTEDEIMSIVESYISNPDLYNKKLEKALTWSQEFTVEKFEDEIEKLLDKDHANKIV